MNNKLDRRSITSAENGKKGGRPRGKASIATEKARLFILEAVEKEMTPIVEKAITDAKNGDKAARDWLSSYAWGKATVTVVTEDDEGNKKELSGNTITFARQDGN